MREHHRTGRLEAVGLGIAGVVDGLQARERDVGFPDDGDVPRQQAGRQ
jgi:hypothetical protein